MVIITPRSVAGLRGILAYAGVPFETWGTGDARTVDDLFREIEEGESELIRCLETGLHRVAEGAVVNVRYYDHEHMKSLILVEARRVFAGGRVEERKIDTSIGEKLKRGESPLRAAHRGLLEELGIAEELPIADLGTRQEGPTPSVSYPGILTTYLKHYFEVWLPERHFIRAGYEEAVAGRTTYFEWRTLAGSAE